MRPRGVSATDDTWEQFVRLWEQFLVDSAEPGTVTVVEGERDRRSLLRLGVAGRISLVHSGQRIGTLTQRLQNGGSRVIVLTDWDRSGGQLAHRLADLLGDGSVVLDLDFRRRLSRVLKGEVVHVEGLAGWARRTAEAAGAALDEWFPDATR